MRPDQPTCPAPGADTVCLQPSAQSPATVHADTKSILSESQFHHSTSNWLTRLEGWLHGILSDVIGWFFSGHGLTYAGLVVAGLLIVLAVFLAARFALRVQSDPAVRVHEDEVGRRPVDWRAEADRHAAAGEWRQALRGQYRALVAELAESGVVEEVPGRTAREYEQQVGINAPAAGPSFAQASDQFEAVWYGLADCSAADLERFTGLAAAVTAAAVTATARSRAGRAA